MFRLINRKDKKYSCYSGIDRSVSLFFQVIGNISNKDKAFSVQQR